MQLTVDNSGMPGVAGGNGDSRREAAVRLHRALPQARVCSTAMRDPAMRLPIEATSSQKIVMTWRV